MARLARLALCVGSFGLAGCLVVEPVPCRDATDCDLRPGGTCVPGASGARWCAYPDGDCPVGLRYSDFRVDESLASTCVEEPPCRPSTTTCAADTLRVCDAAGVEQASACPLGCHPSQTRCFELEPRNVGIATCLASAAVESDVTIPDGAVIDTDTGAITVPGEGTVVMPSEPIAAPAGGVAVRCFRARALTIGDVEVHGAAAITLVAQGPITVRGRISVSARGIETPGPGALSGPSPCEGGPGLGTEFLHRGGGGGGGFGTAGGRGGDASGAAGGAAGAASGSPELVPLRGGCGGGKITAGTTGNAAGAIQLVSTVSMTIEPGAGIEASGWGGGNDNAALPLPYGGGSGGAILVEAPIITTSAGSFLTANGGGGGAKATGQRGMISTARAAGGMADAVGSPLYGGGGPGGATDVALSGASLTTVGYGGGGGGAAGRVRLNSYVPFAPAPATVLSPSPSQGSVVRR